MMPTAARLTGDDGAPTSARPSQREFASVIAAPRSSAAEPMAHHGQRSGTSPANNPTTAPCGTELSASHISDDGNATRATLIASQPPRIRKNRKKTNGAAAP